MVLVTAAGKLLNRLLLGYQSKSELVDDTNQLLCMARDVGVLSRAPSDGNDATSNHVFFVKYLGS